MGVTTNFRTGENPVDILAAFKEQAQARYTAVYVKSGNGRHAFGHAEFHTMQELEQEVRDAARKYNLNTDKFSVDLTASTAIMTFDDKRIYGKFMDAMIGKNVKRDNLVVQISGKSREWHQAAGESLAYTARVRREQGLPDSPAYQKNVTGFGHLLVDYVFKDIDTMQGFCADVVSLNVDHRAKEMRRAGQTHHGTKPA